MEFELIEDKVNQYIPFLAVIDTSNKKLKEKNSINITRSNIKSMSKFLE